MILKYQYTIKKNNIKKHLNKILKYLHDVRIPRCMVLNYLYGIKLHMT